MDVLKVGRNPRLVVFDSWLAELKNELPPIVNKIKELELGIEHFNVRVDFLDNLRVDKKNPTLRNQYVTAINTMTIELNGLLEVKQQKEELIRTIQEEIVKIESFNA